MPDPSARSEGPGDERRDSPDERRDSRDEPLDSPDERHRSWAGPHGAWDLPHGPRSAGDTAQETSAAWALVRLGLVLGAIVAVFLAVSLGDLLIFIVALVLMVVLHELGHYLTAKWSRMKVTEFFIGFGPRLWSHRFGETEYGFKPILAGAYVKIPGMSNLEQIDEADEPHTYRQKPFHRRILVASAGSIMHYVIALVLAFALALSVGVPTGNQVMVAGFSTWAGHKQTAAQAAGMKTGDRIISVDGKKVTTTAQFSKAVQAAEGRAVTVVVEHDGHRATLTVQPRAGHVVRSGKTATREVLGAGTSGAKTEWLVGIGTNVTPIFSSQNPLLAAKWAGDEVGSFTWLTVLGFGRVFSPGGLSSLFHQVTNSEAAKKAAANPNTSDRISSVVGIGRLATQAEQKGAFYFVSILIYLSIALGLINMLPMLPLDGGHVAIALYERIRTRRGRPYYQADIAKLLPVVYGFVAVLVLVVGSAIFLDIAHPIANPFG